jgi:hypothetical protein
MTEQNSCAATYGRPQRPPDDLRALACDEFTAGVVNTTSFSMMLAHETTTVDAPDWPPVRLYFERKRDGTVTGLMTIRFARRRV